MARRPQLPPLSSLVVAAVGIYLAYRIHDILIPFALSFALAYLLNPAIHFFEARGLRRELIVLTLYGIVAISITVAANFLLPAMTSELALLQGKAPGYFTQMTKLFASMQSALAAKLPIGQSYVESLSFKMYDPLMKQLPKIPSYVLGLFPLFSLLFLVPFITFFILLDSDRLLQKAVQICPSRYVEQVLHLVSEIDTSLGNYIRGILTIAFGIGIASYLGLRFLDVDYALGIATLAGVASFIPYVGAILGMIVGALVAFFQYQTFAVPAQVVVLFVGIRLADETCLAPLVSKHAINLHPLVFLLAMMVGGKIFGFVGLLFAVPAACVAKALIIVAWGWYVTEAQIQQREPVAGSEVPYL